LAENKFISQRIIRDMGLACDWPCGYAHCGEYKG